MEKEHFLREKGWNIPVAEIRMEDECLFAHYDIDKDEQHTSYDGEEDGEYMHYDNGMEPYIACYIRVKHTATLESITEAIKANGCADVEKSAEAIYSLYLTELKKREQAKEHSGEHEVESLTGNEEKEEAEE